MRANFLVIFVIILQSQRISTTKQAARFFDQFTNQTTSIKFDPIADLIRNKLEDLRRLLQNGNETLALPSFDPLNLKTLPINLDNYNITGISGRINFENFLLYGVPSWNVTNIKSDITIDPIGAKIALSVLWPYCSLGAYYNAKIKASGRVIKGRGTIMANAFKFGVDFEAHAVFSSKFGIESLSIRPNLSDIKLAVTNLSIDGIDYSELISSMGNNGAKLIKQHVDVIDNALSQLIMESIHVHRQLQFKNIVASLLNQFLAH